MSGPADPAGAGDPCLGVWSFWDMQKNGGLSAASISVVRESLGLGAASTSTTVKNKGYSTWTSVDGERRPHSPAPMDLLAHGSTVNNSRYSFCRPLAPTGPLAHPEYNHHIAELYLEAARRLPIAELPDLADCISYSGLAVGLADPVTNIILTTINAFARIPFYVVPVPVVPVMPNALERTRKEDTFVAGARDSRAGLVSFLLCYFRDLTVAQAEKCLDMACHDLPLAVLLVETGRRGSQVPVLRPDARRTKTALQQAVYDAGYSKTDELVRLMTWRYPRDLLDPVLDDLRGGKQLSAECVYKICDLLRCSWPPPPTPPPTPGTYRDNSGNVTTITMIRKDVFARTTISKDLVPTTTIILTCPSSDDYTDNSVHLSTVLAPERSSRVSNIVSSCQEDPDFLSLFKMFLLDMVHGFYIDALGILPSHALREDHLISAVLTAGHCYGPLDPVSNIVLNSIWYDVVFPLSNAVSKKVGAADILDARSLSRVESRSLDGLVSFVCHTYSVPEQHAVVLLCENRFNLSSILHGPNKVFFNFGSAALVAKHPKPAAFGDFLNSLTSRELDSLRSLLVSDKGQGYVLSDDTLERLKMMVSKKTPGSATATVQTIAPKLGQSALWTVSERRSTFRSQQAYVRTRLENLLLDYGNNEGHIYKLGVICGVATARCGGFRSIGTTCYHVNFLASTDVPNDATRSYCSRQLFFAEFWTIPYDRIEMSTNPPFCCPVEDSFDPYSIRCIVCDDTSCMIAHPSTCEHAYFTGNDDPRFPVHHQWGEDLGGMLEFDFIYFNRESHESATILLEELSSCARKMQRFC